MAIASNPTVTATVAGTGNGKTLRSRIWSARWCYLFMLPNLVLSAMFTFYPAVMSWYFAFLDWSTTSSFGTPTSALSCS
jgi:multiple sugar transport system permease protein